MGMGLEGKTEVMRILWLTNIEVSVISEYRRSEKSNIGGWLNSVSALLIEAGNEICFLYPAKEINEGQFGKVFYRSFKDYDVEVFEKTLDEIKPDCIHIWGTEYEYSLSLIEACKNKKLIDCTVVSIQGLVFFCGYYHYISGIPEKVVNRNTIRDLLKRTNVCKERKNFVKRGDAERRAFSMAKNVIGRTHWDYMCVKSYNPEINYYHCNETLREAFYHARWDINMCNRYQIFMSQGQYPIKGLHMALEAVRLLKMKYVDVKLYVICDNVFEHPWYRISSYHKYIKNLIENYNIKSNVVFLPPQTEEQMVKLYLSSRVFINPSSVENSSNSIGEAMLVGCPCVVSDVGGTKSLLKDGVEGYLYPYNEPYTLASYISKLFESDNEALELSAASIKRAKITHNKEQNYERLVGIYEKLVR